MEFNTMLHIVASTLKITSAEILNHTRYRPQVEARQILYLLLEEVNGETAAQIGLHFCKHRTTIIFGLEQAKAIITVDKDFKEKYEKCKAAINGSATN